MSEIEIFDKKLRRLRRGRSKKIIHHHDFLINTATKNLSLRLDEEINVDFSRVLNIGRNYRLPEFENTKLFVCADIIRPADVCLDEDVIPFKNESFDLVFSTMNFHWVNDLPGCLVQIRNILSDKGLLLFNILGGDTLNELKIVLAETEIELKGGVSPRISPMIDIKDMGMLLQRAGYKMPVVDSENITVFYPDIFSLIKDLRGMGETNALLKKPQTGLSKSFLKAVDEKYKRLYANDEGLIPASFEIITCTAWKS